MSESAQGTRRRSGMRGALAAGVAAALLAAMAWLPTDARSAPAPGSCSASAASGKIGASPGAGILSASAADLDRELSAARDMGMWSIRIDVDWSVVEPIPGQRNWAPVDRVVDATLAHGMCPLGMVAYTPIWAARPSDGPTNTHFRPADPAAFAGFAAAAAQRYVSSISVWEIWNEPNRADYWLPKADSAGYGQLLVAASAAIRRAVPGVSVISGGLAPATDNGRDIAPLTFVRDLYGAGVNGSFDALAVHPYTYPALPNDPTTSSWNTAQRMWDMHDVMVAAGDGNKQIWMTEFGAPTGTASNAVSESTQLQSIQIAHQAQADTPWLGPLFIYSIRDAGTDPADPEQNFGMLRRDWSPKQSYVELANNA